MVRVLAVKILFTLATTKHTDSVIIPFLYNPFQYKVICDNHSPSLLQLPHSVNTDALNAKMKEVGKIVFGEMTGPGRAIVRFQNTTDAERCISILF